MKINCQCGEKHNISGKYPYVCVKTQKHYCPCGAELKGEEHGPMGQPIYDGRDCLVCGRSFKDLCQCGLPKEEGSELCKVCGY
jgi:hypothetical protein